MRSWSWTLFWVCAGSVQCQSTWPCTVQPHMVPVYAISGHTFQSWALKRCPEPCKWVSGLTKRNYAIFNTIHGIRHTAYRNWNRSMKAYLWLILRCLKKFFRPCTEMGDPTQPGSGLWGLTKVTGILIATLERAWHFSLETTLSVHIVCYLYMSSAFEGHGNTYEPVRIYACRT
jgi:hypothetical protein